MLQLEVLVLELLAVDGLAAGAVVVGEVTALQHVLGDDAVEAGARVAVAVLAGAQLPEVARGLRDDLVEEVEDDAARGRAVDGDVEVDVVAHGVHPVTPGAVRYPAGPQPRLRAGQPLVRVPVPFAASRAYTQRSLLHAYTTPASATGAPVISPPVASFQRSWPPAASRV